MVTYRMVPWTQVKGADQQLNTTFAEYRRRKAFAAWHARRVSLFYNRIGPR